MTFAKPLAAALLVAGLAATPAMAADPTGQWQTASGDSRYVVTYCGDGNQLCAKLVWLRPDARTDANLAYLNRFVVSGAVPVSANSWKGNVAYDGDVYAGQMTMVSNDQLKLRGCKGMFCQSLSFVRI